MGKVSKRGGLWPAGGRLMDGDRDCLVRFCPGYESADEGYGVKECNEYGFPIDDRILTAQEVGEIVLKKLHEEF